MENSRLLDVSGIDLAVDSAKRYGSVTVLNRALPDVRDGLKPVQRRIMLGFKDFKLSSSSRYKKMAAVTGAVMGSYHPHGDSSINDAMVRLSQSWVMRAPLVDIEGNNGSLDKDAAASARYLEVRGTKFSELMLDGLSTSGIKMYPNYDNSLEMPEVLPVKFPSLYTNGTMGIAFGYSTNIPPHNPNELLDACVYLNDNPDSTVSDLMRYVKSPDFPTGGLISGLDGIRAMYETGSGSFELRGTVEYEGQNIIITQIPYGLAKTEVLQSIESALVKTKIDSRVKSLRDESEGYGVRLVVECQRGVDLRSIEEVLYQKSKLSTMIHAQCIAIVDGKPEELSLKRYLEVFLDFRRRVVYSQLKAEYTKLYARFHIVEGLIRLYDISDEVVRMIRQANGKLDVIEKLESMFGFSKEQAESIAMMRLYKISNQDLLSLENERDSLYVRIEELIHLMRDKDAFREYIKQDLLTVKETFVDVTRLSQLVSVFETVEVDLTEVVAPVKTHVVVRPLGAQRMTSAVFDANKAEFGQDVIFESSALTSNGVLLFSKAGMVVQRLADDLEQKSIRQQPDDLHKSIKQLDSKDEFINACLFDLSEVDDYYVVSITKLGMVKVSKLSSLLMSYSTKSYLNRSKVFNGLKVDGDEVLAVRVVRSSDLDNLTIDLKSGRSHKQIRIADLTVQGASGSGMRGIKVKEGLNLFYEWLDADDSVVEPEL